MQKDKKIPPNFKVSIKQKLLASSYPIQDIPEAYFPYPPYPQQSHLIQSLHKTIISSQNSLIESPTGTGKTLCLLVSALSALKTMNNKQIKIFYLTRTHSQISQVINELKKTIYVTRVNIMASRDHLCVNPNTREVKGRVLQKVCNDLVNQKSCLFSQGENRKVYVSKKEILQLQQFRDECKKQLVCPFFYSRQLIQKTEVTILPFNYFLDWKMFQSFSTVIKNSVIIFDEAHNVDSIAEDGANLQIDSRLLGYGIGELKGLEKKFSFESQTNLKSKSLVKTAYMRLQRLKNSIQQQRQRTFCSKSQLQQFIASSTSIADPQHQTQSLQGLDLRDSMQFFQNLHQVSKLFYKKQIQPTSFLNIIAALEKLCALWKDHGFQKNFISKIIPSDDEKSFVLRLKCLSASVGFKKLVESQPRSIILSSGTLGNLQKWQKYLNIQFHQKLKIQSFISRDQLFSTIIPKSQSQYTFEFSYQKKDYQNQHRQAAQELSRIQQTIPSGNGIVVAFSTYLLMEKVIRFCNGLRKKVFYQSKGGDVTKIFADYSQAAKAQGAFLFIVMKGRFSQGINFSDYLCRCLVIVGIPFLPRKQPSIQQKMSYIKQNFSQQQAEEWYKQQTFLAVNQTIGRVIRSKKDYGVILLMDQRYQKRENLELLSGWFRKCVRQGGNTYQGIKEFFKKEGWVQKSDKEKEKEKEKESEGKEVLKKLEGEELAGVKTLKRKKRHLKLKYDSEQKQRPSSKKGHSILDQNDTSSQKHSTAKINIKSNHKRKPKKNSPPQNQFKTPTRPPRSITSAASIVLSKINIDKKQKLRGFVNNRMLNVRNVDGRSIFQSEKKEKQKEKGKEDEVKNTADLRKTQTKLAKKKKTESIDAEMSPYLQYFMM